MSARQRERQDPAVLFWRHVTKGEGCWEWTGAMGTHNDPRMSITHSGPGPKQKAVSARRFAYELRFGPIPAGMAVRQTCGRSTCVRPDHLVLVSLSEIRSATMRATRRQHPELGVDQRGERNPASKLTARQVTDLRAHSQAGARVRDLAREFGIGRQAVGAILHGRRWQHLFPEPLQPHSSSSGGRLTPEQRREIVDRYEPGKVSLGDLAGEFGVSRERIRQIVRCARQTPNGSAQNQEDGGA